MIPHRSKKLRIVMQIVWWGVVDSARGWMRQNEFMNTVGTRGAWIEIPAMFSRHGAEDVVTKNRRNYWIEYGRYPDV